MPFDPIDFVMNGLLISACAAGVVAALIHLLSGGNDE